MLVTNVAQRPTEWIGADRNRRYLDELIRRPQWVAHRAKKPINPATGTLASPTDRQTWNTYAAALACSSDGIGFVLTADDPYTVIDLDKCRNADTGQVEPDALAIVDRFNSYTEVSPSGTGLHIWIRASLPGDRKRTGHIEMYDRERYMTVTARTLPGYAKPIRTAQDELEAFYADVFPAPVASTPAAAVTLSLEDRDILDMLQREHTGKAGALLRGDAGEYGGDFSEARMALAWKAAFYTDDAEQIARILFASGLFKAGLSERERERKARNDGQKAVSTYTGPRYDPDRTTARIIIAPPIAPAAEGDDLDNLSADQLRAMVRQQAAELKQYRHVVNAISEIAACDQIEAGPRLTAIGVLFVGLEMQAKGKKPTPAGYHMPASWIARKTGQTDKTVSGHLRKLQGDPRTKKPAIIDRTVKSEKVRITDDLIDKSSGETWRETREANGKRNYIAFPDNVLDFSARFATYRRPADAPKHGGERDTCPNHPDAGTYTEHITRCAECHEVIETKTTISSEIRERIKSTPKMGLDNSVTIGVPKMGLDSPVSDSTPKMGSEWQDEHRAIYGERYREVPA